VQQDLRKTAKHPVSYVGNAQKGQCRAPALAPGVPWASNEPLGRLQRHCRACAALQPTNTVHGSTRTCDNGAYDAQPVRGSFGAGRGEHLSRPMPAKAQSAELVPRRKGMGKPIPAPARRLSPAAHGLSAHGAARVPCPPKWGPPPTAAAAPGTAVQAL